eukprot:3743782-Rhodomonas_salina.1
MLRGFAVSWSTVLMSAANAQSIASFVAVNMMNSAIRVVSAVSGVLGVLGASGALLELAIRSAA